MYKQLWKILDSVHGTVSPSIIIPQILFSARRDKHRRLLQDIIRNRDDGIRLPQQLVAMTTGKPRQPKVPTGTNLVSPAWFKVNEPLFAGWCYPVGTGRSKWFGTDSKGMENERLFSSLLTRHHAKRNNTRKSLCIDYTCGGVCNAGSDCPHAHRPRSRFGYAGGDEDQRRVDEAVKRIFA
jgi:hypothetical protein